MRMVIKLCLDCGKTGGEVVFVGRYCRACSSRKYRKAKWDKLPNPPEGYKTCIRCKTPYPTNFFGFTGINLPPHTTNDPVSDICTMHSPESSFLAPSSPVRRPPLRRRPQAPTVVRILNWSGGLASHQHSPSW